MKKDKDNFFWVEVYDYDWGRMEVISKEDHLAKITALEARINELRLREE